MAYDPYGPAPELCPLHRQQWNEWRTYRGIERGVNDRWISAEDRDADTIERMHDLIAELHAVGANCGPARIS